MIPKKSDVIVYLYFFFAKHFNYFRIRSLKWIANAVITIYIYLISYSSFIYTYLQRFLRLTSKGTWDSAVPMSHWSLFLESSSDTICNTKARIRLWISACTARVSRILQTENCISVIEQWRIRRNIGINNEISRSIKPTWQAGKYII